MRSRLTSLATVVAVALSLVSSGTQFVHSYAGPSDVIRIEGGQISGTMADGIRSFKGIPFAAPPVGTLRWKAPQPVVPWNGVRACDTFGPECPQAQYPQASMY